MHGLTKSSENIFSIFLFQITCFRIRKIPHSHQHINRYRSLIDCFSLFWAKFFIALMSCIKCFRKVSPFCLLSHFRALLWSRRRAVAPHLTVGGTWGGTALESSSQGPPSWGSLRGLHGPIAAHDAQHPEGWGGERREQNSSRLCEVASRQPKTPPGKQDLPELQGI